MNTRPEATPPAAATWDVFVSYSRSDAQRAGALASALRRCGLAVFLDDTAVEDFASITHTIAAGLGRSRALLALYSYDYPQRRACQWELTYAYLSGQREGDPRRRVLVVNPETGADHVQPLEVRDALHWSWPDSGDALDRLAARVAAHVARLASPMADTGPDPAPSAAVPWLPAPARVGSSRFTGRLPEQWRVHSALHRHRAPLIQSTGQGADRAAQLRGMPGIGKSLLAQEYALRFRSAFPGGTFWFDLHAARGASVSTALDSYAEQVATVADALALDRPADAGLPQLLSRLAVLLSERGAPCLWVVDGVPDGLTDAQLHLLRGPHLLASSLMTTRSLRYTAFAETIDLPPLAEPDGYRLLTSHRAPRDEIEETSAQALVHDLGGHPQALDLLAAKATSSDFGRLRNRLHAPGADLLGSPEAEDGRPPLTATLLSRPLSGRAPADDVLRLLALACPAPLSQSALETALSALPPYGPWATGGLVGHALDALLGSGSLRPGSFQERSWTIHPLLARAVRRHDPDTARQEDLRKVLLQALTPLDSPARDGEAARLTITRETSTPGPLERSAAFDLQVELVTRVGVQPLAEGAGSLREALSSLHTLFTAARDALHRVADEITIPVHLASIVAHLLNLRLRPFLTRWHTALQQHEAARPPTVSVIDHEREWPRSDEMRAELLALRGPLTDAATDLAAICGVSLLEPTPRRP
ncbi:toll/interleukin-1 receptor domain-containing protein [Streptomyces sp. AJS327]|uniref:tetratricopeptide repeat protein n=1 Tax=Streptomyces sp. AJS327 TaxID=2545265 RepID=UPI0015DF2495|nr:TIR domain-containing protein [Streptomyces sp. AJS327]MBA0053719.1 toll/interleukin-1 receptor domain-containing protein [Streptomyces sp. AJS327]